MQWMPGRCKWGCCNSSSIKYHCFHSWFFGFRIIRWWLCQPWLAWGMHLLFFSLFSFYFWCPSLYEISKFLFICAERWSQNCCFIFKKPQTNFTYWSMGTIYGCSYLVRYLVFVQSLLWKFTNLFGYLLACWFLPLLFSWLVLELALLLSPLFFHVCLNNCFSGFISTRRWLDISLFLKLSDPMCILLLDR